MKELLFLKASPRGADSDSGSVAETFVDKWLTANPGAVVNRRDVGPGKVVGPDQSWVEANITAGDRRTEEQCRLLEQSDKFIEELRRASHIVIATPMYNFSVPWNLKAYIDNIVREGETFFFSPETGHGPLLAEGKKLLLMWSAAGDYSPDSEMGSYDLLTPTIGAVFGFMGVYDYSVISYGNRGEAPELEEATRKACHEQIAELSVKW